MKKTNPSRHPNVLWLMSDQHNANCLGVAGHPDVKTPHLDAIASKSVRFTNAFCNNPVCAPSRACFLTSQYCHTHGITGNSVFEYEETRPYSVATHFRFHGYQTALIGKGHLPRLWMEDGFEYRRYSDLADSEANDPLTCDYFRHLVEHGLADRYDHGTLNPPHPGASMRAFTSELPLAHSLETWTGDEALTFLRARDEIRPFFLQLSFQRPHDPFAPSPESTGLYNPENLSLPDSTRDYFENRFASKPAWQREFISKGKEGYPYRPHDPADLKRQLAHHFALITEIDAQIGRVIAHLKAIGEWENTIVCYHADHGDFAGEHGLALKNFGIYESIHKIPFLLRGPGLPTGSEHGSLVESIDLAPTFCELAGLPIPDSFEGRPLRAMIEGHSSKLDVTFCEFDFPRPAMATTFAARSEEYRLVLYAANPEDGELYHRINDPGELHNCFDDPACRDIRESLTRRLIFHLGRFRRNWSFHDDMNPARTGPPGLARLLHKGKTTWQQTRQILPSCNC